MTGPAPPARRRGQPRPSGDTVAAAVLWGAPTLVLALGLVAALALPYHEWDALAYGEWSRLIADHGGIRFSGITDQTYHRPLFYVLQGWIWASLGFHEPLGRLLALAFAVLAVVTSARLASRASAAPAAGALAAAVLVLVPSFRAGAASGLTDVPVAALTAAMLLTVWSHVPTRVTSAVLVVLAASTCLVKPTGLVVVASASLAVIVLPVGTRREALLHRLIPLAVGTAIALVYHAIQAAYLDEGLLAFLRAGSTGHYTELARAARVDALAHAEWLGQETRGVVLFATAYAVLRICRVPHAVAAGAGIALGAGAVSALWGTGSTQAGVLGLVLTASCLPALAAPPWAAPDPRWLARLLLCALVPLSAWILWGGYDIRLASPAWPALAALAAICWAPAASARIGRLRLGVPLAVSVLAAATLGYGEVDGLGRARWTDVRALGLSGLTDRSRTGRIALGELAEVMDLVQSEAGAGGRVIGGEGSLRFALPGRVTQEYPGSCSALRGYRVFVLLTGGDAQSYMRDVARVPADPTYWASCSSPRTTQLTSGTNGWAVFRVEDAG